MYLEANIEIKHTKNLRFIIQSIKALNKYEFKLELTKCGFDVLRKNEDLENRPTIHRHD